MTKQILPLINLLPWREARQLRRRQLFYISLVSSVTLTLAAVAGAMVLAMSAVSQQEQGNTDIRTEITSLQQHRNEQDVVFAGYQRQQADFARTRHLHAARIRQARMLAQVPAMVPTGVTLTRLRYEPPAIVIQGSAASARQVSHWLAMLDEFANINRPELQSLYVDENHQPDVRQVYFYSIRAELSAPEIDRMAPKEGG